MASTSSQTNFHATEQKRAPRISFEQKVLFKKNQKENYTGLLKDFSTTGAYLVSTEFLPPQTRIELFMGLGVDGKKQLLKLSGRVVRIESKESSLLRGYGLRFEEASVRDTNGAIADYVEYKTTGRVPEGKLTSPVIKRERTSPLHQVRFSAREFANSGTRLKGAQSKRMKRKNPDRTFLEPRNVMALLIVTGIALILAYSQLIRPTTLAWSLSKHLPMMNATIENGVLKAEVATDWNQNSSRSLKEKHLASLSEALRSNDVSQAILRNSEGKSVALILSNRSDPKSPVIRIIQ